MEDAEELSDLLVFAVFCTKQGQVCLILRLLACLHHVLTRQVNALLLFASEHVLQLLI